MNHIIEIKQLKKNYAGFSLHNISFNIPYGKIIGLIGENGAGKTTLISLLLNQRKRDSGIINIFGFDNIKEEKIIKTDIGFVLDEFFFHPCFNSKNTNSIMRKIYSEWNTDFFYSLLSRFGLDKKKNFSDFSKGMKTKLMLAIALSHNPKLLILDEVTSGLDPVIRDEILAMLKDFVKNEEKSVFFSTHITSDLDKIADYVAFLDKGNLIFFESLNELKNSLVQAIVKIEDYNDIDQNSIFAQYKDENTDEYVLLLKYLPNENISFRKISEPTLEDIMLVYIKGGKMYDRINNQRSTIDN